LYPNCSYLRGDCARGEIQVAQVQDGIRQRLADVWHLLVCIVVAAKGLEQFSSQPMHICCFVALEALV
jgi:hypothetical protein